jgi:hypothetical protein
MFVNETLAVREFSSTFGLEESILWLQSTTRNTCITLALACVLIYDSGAFLTITFGISLTLAKSLYNGQRGTYSSVTANIGRI